MRRGVSEADPVSELVRLKVEHIVEEALESQVAEILGRGYLECGAASGSRNGNRRGTLKTGEGHPGQRQGCMAGLISSGEPDATTYPPSSPPSGPRSIM